MYGSEMEEFPFLPSILMQGCKLMTLSYGTQELISTSSQQA